MGLLATAGMVSGMGQGLERGLQSLQTGLIQQGLQDDRFNKEAVVRESEHGFQSEKLKEQLAHAERLQIENQGHNERLQKQSQDATHAEGEATRALHLKTEGYRNTIAAGIAEDNRAAAAGKQSVTERAVASQEKFDQARADWYRSVNKMQGKSPDPMKDLSAKQKAQGLAREKSANGRYKMALEASKIGDTDTADHYMQQGDDLMEEAAIFYSGGTIQKSKGGKSALDLGEFEEDGAPTVKSHVPPAPSSKIGSPAAPPEGKPRADHIVPFSPAGYAHIEPGDALTGGASLALDKAKAGLVNLATPYSGQASRGVTIEKPQPTLNDVMDYIEAEGGSEQKKQEVRSGYLKRFGSPPTQELLSLLRKAGAR